MSLTYPSEQQNFQVGKDRDATELILGNLPSRFAPDPRTYKIIGRLMDSLPVKVGEDQVVEAFYEYFDATIKTVGVAAIEDM